jgi:hypothetical protein
MIILSSTGVERGSVLGAINAVAVVIRVGFIAARVGSVSIRIGSVEGNANSHITRASLAIAVSGVEENVVDSTITICESLTFEHGNIAVNHSIRTPRWCRSSFSCSVAIATLEKVLEEAFTIANKTGDCASNCAGGTRIFVLLDSRDNNSGIGAQFLNGDVYILAVGRPELLFAGFGFLTAQILSRDMRQEESTQEKENSSDFHGFMRCVVL